NLPTVLNAFGTIRSDDQVVITGLAVNPVADLTSFANVNGNFAFFSGKIGEILYVSYTDNESGLNLTANNTPVRSGLLAFPIADVVSPAGTGASGNGIISPAGFPITVGAAFAELFSVFANIGGISCDDDGNVYYSQADLVQFTGGNIVKVTGVDLPGVNQDRSLATNGFLTITPLNPTTRFYGTASRPSSQL